MGVLTWEASNGIILGNTEEGIDAQDEGVEGGDRGRSGDPTDSGANLSDVDSVESLLELELELTLVSELNLVFLAMVGEVETSDSGAGLDVIFSVLPLLELEFTLVSELVLAFLAMVGEIGIGRFVAWAAVPSAGPLEFLPSSFSTDGGR